MVAEDTPSNNESTASASPRDVAGKEDDSVNDLAAHAACMYSLYKEQAVDDLVSMIAYYKTYTKNCPYFSNGLLQLQHQYFNTMVYHERDIWSHIFITNH